MNLKNNIEKICKSKGVTIKSLAAMIKMSEANLYRRFEANSIETKHLEKISIALEVPIQSFFNDTIAQTIQNDSSKPKVFLAFELSSDQEDKIVTMVLGKEFIKLLNK